MKFSPKWILKWMMPFLWALPLVLTANHFISIKTKIYLKNNKPLDIIQIFAAENKQFSEWHSQRRHVPMGTSHRVFTFNVPIRPNECLRIDPSATIGEIRLFQIEFTSPFNSYQLTASEIHALFQPIFHIKEWTFQNNSAIVQTSGRDSQLITCQLDPLIIDQLNQDIWKIKLPLIFFILLLTVIDGWFSGTRRLLDGIIKKQSYRGRSASRTLVLIGISVAIVLMSVSAIQTWYNVHPDERMHNLAASYYEDHWLPPDLDDPAVQVLYLKSGWGVSYLSHLDLAYLFAAKFSNLTKKFTENRYLRLRFFNIALLILVVTCAFVCNKQGAIVILLVSPQVWYVFSYFNGDAFPLGLSIIAAALLLKMGESTKLMPTFLTCLGLGMAIGLLTLSKRNYLIFLGFLAVYCLWRIYFTPPIQRKRLALLMISSVVIGLSIFSSFKYLDVSINGPHKKKKVVELAEKYAVPKYKPSTQKSNQSAKYFHLRDQGVPFKDLLFNSNWHKISFKSFWGTYGHMVVSAPSYYYLVIFALVSIFIVIFFTKFIFMMSFTDRSLAIIFIGFVLLTVLASIYHSWTYDYQPQGRYLFPLVGMTVISFNHLVKYFSRQFLLLLVGTFYLLSAYSFFFIGTSNLI